MCLEIRFTALQVLFLEHWRLFCVHWRYGCQDTGEKLYLPACKLGLGHSPFHFSNIGGYFASNGGMVTKI